MHTYTHDDWLSEVSNVCELCLNTAGKNKKSNLEPLWLSFFKELLFLIPHRAQHTQAKRSVSALRKGFHWTSPTDGLDRTLQDLSWTLSKSTAQDSNLMKNRTLPWVRGKGVAPPKQPDKPAPSQLLSAWLIRTIWCRQLFCEAILSTKSQYLF